MASVVRVLLMRPRTLGSGFVRRATQDEGIIYALDTHQCMKIASRCANMIWNQQTYLLPRTQVYDGGLLRCIFRDLPSKIPRWDVSKFCFLPNLLFQSGYSDPH